MKKLLIALFAFTFMFTLAACDGDTLVELEDFINEVDANNDVLDASIATLQTELEGLQAELDALEGQSDAADVLIAEITAGIFAINLTLTTDVAAADVLIAELIEKVDELELVTRPDLPFLAETQIVLVHTNDVHGRVNADSWAGSMGMATVKNIVDEIDARYDNTFLISAGDIVHGTTFATLENGESVISVMNMVGYDLMTIGNHEFDYGQDQLLVLEGLADFPMVSANIEYGVGHASYDAAVDADNSMFNPYVIEDFDGVKVAFFGLTSEETVYKTHPLNVTDLVFLDAIAQSEAMVELLTPLADVIILVGHVGLDGSTDITTEDIANAVDGIDVIIDGHSHSTLQNGMWVNDTLIVSTGEYMKNLGVVSITVQGGQIIDTTATLISADDAEALGYGDNAEVQEFIDGISAAQEVILGEVVGQTSQLLIGERDYVRTGETNLGNIITDAMLEVTGADVAFTNGGGIRASIPAGPVTLGQIITVLPFGNIIHTKVVTGAELLAILEHGTSSYPDSSGKFPHVAGMTFDINTDNAEGARVENVLIDGTALDLVATYTLATNDFLAAGGDGYDMLVGIPTAGEFMGLHEALESMFTVGEDIDTPTMGRITVTPALPVSPLFFSEYGEPDGGNCKYAEIFNPSAEAVNLAGYSTVRGSNGAMFNLDYAVPLYGWLEAGEVLVLGNADCFDGGDTGSIDGGFPQTGLNFIVDTTVAYTNGDDAFALLYNDVIIDQFGLEGTDPGSSWPVGAGDLLGGFTANVILVRVSTVTSGETDWAVGAMQWTVLDHRDYSSVGTHTTD